MAHTIAVSGKGGAGKTTLCAAMIRCLTLEADQAVLAVDADPNSTLGAMLGWEPERTVAEIREDAREDRLGLTPGMSKDRQVEYLIQTCVAEGSRFDLLTMGRPEGPKCYCYVNNLLRKFLDEVSAHYPYVIVDNEAGMEHLSRRTTNNVDELLIVAEATAIGVRTARRIRDLASKLPILVKRTRGILSAVRGGAPGRVLEGFEQMGLEVAAVIPYDDNVYEMAASGGTIFDLPADSPALRAVSAFVRERLVAPS